MASNGLHGNNNSIVGSADRAQHSLLVSVIEGFRVCLLGGEMDWGFIMPGMIVALVILVTGALYFKRTEHFVVDVI